MTAMRLKSDVKTTGLRPELLLALITVRDVYSRHGRDLVITSLLDGAHAKTSLHYAGCAADLRIRDSLNPFTPWPDSTVGAIAADIRKALTADYDVIVERDHIHLEYQPRRPE